MEVSSSPSLVSRVTGKRFCLTESATGVTILTRRSPFAPGPSPGVLFSWYPLMVLIMIVCLLDRFSQSRLGASRFRFRKSSTSFARKRTRRPTLVARISPRFLSRHKVGVDTASSSRTSDSVRHVFIELSSFGPALSGACPPRPSGASWVQTDMLGPSY